MRKGRGEEGMYRVAGGEAWISGGEGMVVGCEERMARGSGG